MINQDDSKTNNSILMEPLIGKNNAVAKHSNCYPGSRRSIRKNLLPKDTMLVKTGGNALQAVDRHCLDQSNLISVTVPDCNIKAGDPLIVVAPDGSGRALTVTVPEGCSAGHVFFVDFSLYSPLRGIPVASVDPSIAVVNGMNQGQQPEKDLEFTEESKTNKIANGIFLVNIPDGTKPGDKIQVALPNNYLIEAIVPDGNAERFYVRLPPGTPGGGYTSSDLTTKELHQIV